MCWRSTLLSAVAALAADPFPARVPSEWAWEDVVGTKCMDGTQTGVYVKRSPNATSKDVAIFLTGGGACFNSATCALAAAGNKPGAPSTGAEFSSTDARNPYLNFHWVAVTYCTGDLHGGQNTAMVGGGMRHFAGRANLQAIMERVLATWPTLDNLVVTGESAGGFGSTLNYHFIRSFYPSSATRGTMIDDSGPFLADSELAACLQQAFREHWHLNATLPSTCACVNSAGNLASLYPWLQKQWPGDVFGLISSRNDTVISDYFSYGNDNCAHNTPSFYDRLYEGLMRLNASSLQVYIIPGGIHTFTGNPLFYIVQVEDKPLYKWIGDLLTSPRAGVAAPPTTEHSVSSTRRTASFESVRFCVAPVVALVAALAGLPLVK